MGLHQVNSKLAKFPLKRSVFCVFGYSGGLQGAFREAYYNGQFPVSRFSKWSPNHLFRRLKMNYIFGGRPSISKNWVLFRQPGILAFVFQYFALVYFLLFIGCYGCLVLLFLCWICGCWCSVLYLLYLLLLLLLSLLLLLLSLFCCCFVVIDFWLLCVVVVVVVLVLVVVDVVVYELLFLLMLSLVVASLLSLFLSC